jgi:hypothetical protein
MYKELDRHQLEEAIPRGVSVVVHVPALDCDCNVVVFLEQFSCCE